jgi:hypothetical protein
VRDEHVIKMRGGSEHIAWPGLLDQAHKEGLVGIDTELRQIPTAENGHVAITKAVAEFRDVDDLGTRTRTFSGIGDASPENVSKGIVPHIIRMSETRAKARALRDGVNVGANEFADEVTGEATGEVRQKTVEKSRETPDEPAAKPSSGTTPGGASKPSANFLYGLMKPNAEDKESLKEWIASLNQKQVSDLIEEQQEKVEA